MKILFVHHGAISANSMNHIGPFAVELKKSGHEVAIAVPELDPTFRFFPYSQVPIICFDDLLDNPHRFDNKAPDIVHAWTPREIVRRFCEKLWQLIQTRWVIHVEDDESAVRQSPDLTDEDLLHRTDPVHGPRFIQQADAYTAIIESLIKNLPTDKPIHTLVPGFDLQASKQNPEPRMDKATFAIPEEFKLITYPGAASGANANDLTDLYTAIHLLNQHGTPCILLKTGFPDLVLRRKLPSGAENWIRDVGYLSRNQLWRFIELADVVVQPGRSNSYNENRLPSKLLDFLCLGKPLVTSSSNLGKRLKDGVNALLLKNSKPEEIAARCQELFSDNELAKSIGRRGREFVLETFNLTRNTAGLSKFYTSVLASPKNSLAVPQGSQIENALNTLEKELSTIVPPSQEALKIRTYLRDLRKKESIRKPVKKEFAPARVEMQIYYPQKPELLELGSLRRWYTPKKNNSCLLPFITQQSLDWLRIDPGQYPGTYILKSWSVLDSNHKPLIEWKPEMESKITCQINGATLGPVTNEGQEIWSLTHDPQLLFAPLPPMDSSRVRWLNIEFKANEVESPITNKLKLRRKPDTLELQEESEINDRIDSLLEILERRRSLVLRFMDRLQKR
jgi:glycosyltransferase involved in cell wall biosynthesis